MLLYVHDEGARIRSFYRVDQSRNKQIVEGHGIGLSLAEKIVSQHGGNITVKSAVNKGSTFTVKLLLAS